MLTTIRSILAEKGISHVCAISLADCTVTRPYLLERAGIREGTAILFAVPYYTTQCDDPARNISAYAVSRDYHLFFRALFDEILPVLSARFPAHRFSGFTDHSPIAEVEAAVRAGLGVYGCNHLLLTHEHSSFVFLGEIVTDAHVGEPVRKEQRCTGCGACMRACPVALDISRCHSALTQKKGELDESEREIIKNGAFLWGCDHCQTACPVTIAAKERGTLYSRIPFFSEGAIPYLTADLLRNMTDEEFATRAYSWRGRDTILRNLELREKGT